MFGISVFLNEDLSDSMKDYIKNMHEMGFQGIFTSIHIPEDESSDYLRRLQQLGIFAKEYKMDLTIDVSANALKKLGIHYNDLTVLIDMGVTAIRVDYGISHEDIARVSQQMNVALNASTLTQVDINQLKDYQVDLSSIEAWHNYYPRPGTGLDKDYLINLNQWIRSQGMKVMAFVPGDDLLRGPIFEGLPTLEKHRYSNSLAATMELVQECYIDKVYIGDPTLSDYAQLQWSKFINEDAIYFLAEKCIDEANQLNHACGRHTQRQDIARDVVRSQEGRLNRTTEITPRNQVERNRGSITVDNQLYKRYEGEVQITKKNLPIDEKVNKVGQIAEMDLLLIDYIKPNQVFEIEWKEDE